VGPGSEWESVFRVTVVSPPRRRPQLRPLEVTSASGLTLMERPRCEGATLQGCSTPGAQLTPVPESWP
jgi:hypothetical protein